MWTLIHPTEYELILSTGEKLHIAEFDVDVYPILLHPSVSKACKSVLLRVPKISREIMEEAKSGYDDRFKPLLKARPDGALLKVLNHQCGLRKECAMFTDGCSTKNIRPRNGGGFPECFEFVPEHDDPDSAAKSVGTSIIHAWREGMYSIIIHN